MRSAKVLKPEIREQTVARMPGVEIEVTSDCVGCGECVERCMFDGIAVKDDLAEINERCRICGRCVDICPSEAIRITVKDDAACVEETIGNLQSRVNYT
jgi:heterodisulfide reductase subunit A-like polyferredoxin